MNAIQKAERYVELAREASSARVKEQHLLEAAHAYARAARKEAREEVYSQLADNAVACMVQSAPLQAVRLLYEFLLSGRLIYRQTALFETLLTMLLLADPAVQALRERYRLQQSALGQDWVRVFGMTELSTQAAPSLEQAFKQERLKVEQMWAGSDSNPSPTEQLLRLWVDAQVPMESARLRSQRSYTSAR